MWATCVRDEIQVVTFSGAEIRAKSSSLCQRGGTDQNTVEKVALENAKTAAESTASENATPEPTARKTDDSGGTSASDAAVERPLGPLKTIIDKELERSCVERSERTLADKAIADSSTAERKVEQRLEERKQLKVQNWRERKTRWSHAPDDDPQRQAAKSKDDFLYIGQ